MRTEPIRRSDYWVLTFCGVCGLLLSFLMMEQVLNPKAAFPFTDYYLNAGVRSICIGTVVVWGAIFVISLWFIAKKRLARGVFIALLALLVALGMLQWVELWWGSTFYYGEVRDKQGLHFPWISAVIFSYVIWRGVGLFKRQKPILKWGLIIVVALLQWLLWGLVYESWNLWQS